MKIPSGNKWSSSFKIFVMVSSQIFFFQYYHGDHTLRKKVKSESCVRFSSLVFHHFRTILLSFQYFETTIVYNSTFTLSITHLTYFVWIRFCHGLSIHIWAWAMVLRGGGSMRKSMWCLLSVKRINTKHFKKLNNWLFKSTNCITQPYLSAACQ